MAGNLLAFLWLGLVLWGTYRVLEVGSAWLNRRSAEKERRSFAEVARRELGGEAISSTGGPSSDVLLATRVQETAVRVTTMHSYDDFGGGVTWLVEIDDPAFDAPRAELPAMVEALRKTAVLPDGFSLEPGKLRYTEPSRSVQITIDRIRALRALLESEPQPASAPAAPPVEVSQ